MSFKGVIFDLDGTLVNSLEDLANSMNKVLIRHDFPAHDIPAYKYLIGNGLENLVHRALPEGARNEELVSRCFDAMMVEYGSR